MHRPALHAAVQFIIFVDTELGRIPDAAIRTIVVTVLSVISGIDHRKERRRMFDSGNAAACVEIGGGG
jgi:hypothetical protein